MIKQPPGGEGMTDSEKLDLLLLNMKSMNERMDNLELQIKQSERILKNEIRNSENLILDEVERVHKILDSHKNDDTKHIA